MSTIVTIQSTDVISSSRTDLNTNFSNLNADKIETSYLDTDTALTANSDSKIATQKATKAYVDASVNPTGRSWNEYAADSVGTDAYAITVSGVTSYVTGMTFKFKAGTANTGACTLNVSGLGAKTIKKDVTTDLATGDILANQDVVVMYDGTNMQLVSPMSGIAKTSDITYPCAPQDFAIKAATSSATDGFCFASNTAGTVFFMAEKSSGASSNWNIYRVLKDSSTGLYYITHSTTLSTGNTQFGMAVAGNYLYVSCYIAAVNSLRRYDVADLANVTSMTFSGTSRVGGMFSDNTDIYIFNTGDTMTKFTISGTTATNAGDVTYTSGITAGDSGYACDGTNVWLSGAGSGFNTSGTVIIKKYALAGGAAISSSTFILNNSAYYGIASGGSCSMGMFLHGSSYLGLAWNWRQVSPTAEVGILAHLSFITKP